MSVDVEDYFHVAALAKVIAAAQWDCIPPRVEANTLRLLDLFEEAEVTATFFVLGWVGERFPRLVTEIHRRGHEVSSHGFSHRLIYEQTQREFKRETVRSKSLLEDLIGAPVLGYRAASYSITSRSLWALDMIAEAGFRYDSSIVPARHDLYGVPDAKRLPHRLVTQDGFDLVEFPPTVYSVAGFQFPVGGGGYFRLYPYPLTRFFLNRVNKRLKSPFIFYLHPWEIDPGQPRVEAGFRSQFRHYLNLEKTESRVRRLLGDFRFTTVRSVLQGLQLL